MTISEALKASKENGKTYSRTSVNQRHYVGWIRFDPDDQRDYKYLNAEDLMADDWELSHVAVEKLTKGKWTSDDNGLPR